MLVELFYESYQYYYKKIIWLKILEEKVILLEKILVICLKMVMKIDNILLKFV